MELTGSGCVRFKLYDDRRVGLIQLTLSELGLIGVVSFHCCVKLVQHFQNLLVDFKCDFSAFFIHPGDIFVYISAPRGDVGIVYFSNGREVLKEFNNLEKYFHQFESRTFPAFLVSSTSCLHMAVLDSAVHPSLFSFCSLWRDVSSLESFSKSLE